MKLKPGQEVFCNGKRFVDEVPDKYLSEKQKKRLEEENSKPKSKSKNKPKADPAPKE